MADGDDLLFRTEPTILTALLRDGRASMRDLAEKTGQYRQKAWRIQQSLESDAVIWGYSAIIDETKLGWSNFLVLATLARPDEAALDAVCAAVPAILDDRAVFVKGVHATDDDLHHWVIDVAARTPLALRKALQALMDAAPNLLSKHPWSSISYTHCANTEKTTRTAKPWRASWKTCGAERTLARLGLPCDHPNR